MSRLEKPTMFYKNMMQKLELGF